MSPATIERLEEFLRDQGRYVPPDWQMHDLATAIPYAGGEVLLVVRLWSSKHHLNYDDEIEEALARIIEGEPV